MTEMEQSTLTHLLLKKKKTTPKLKAKTIIEFHDFAVQYLSRAQLYHSSIPHSIYLVFTCQMGRFGRLKVASFLED